MQFINLFISNRVYHRNSFQHSETPSKINRSCHHLTADKNDQPTSPRANLQKRGREGEKNMKVFLREKSRGELGYYDFD
jgi:hypothetical protein